MTESSARSPRFPLTQWALVLTARDKALPDAASARESLFRAYWFPLYAYVRRSGRSPHDAQDLTQAFFGKLVEKDWLTAVSRDRGRFRTFMIVAMKRFMANEYDRSRTEKRGGLHTFVPLDTPGAEERYLAEVTPAGDADRLYERRWAIALLERVLVRLREDYEAGGRGRDFDKLKLYLTANRGEVPYAELAAATGSTEGAVRVAIHRMRSRFRQVFRECVADTVSDPAETDAELRHIIGVLGRG